MLHVQIKKKNKEIVVLALGGDLIGETVQILAKEGKEQQKESKCMVLDLHGVRFIDSAGIDLLRSWSGAHLQLQGGSAFIQALLKAHKLI
jgi:anti-anti-sigma factor